MKIENISVEKWVNVKNINNLCKHIVFVLLKDYRKDIELLFVIPYNRLHLLSINWV